MEIPKLFHPLLFSFFPTFYVYSQNIHVLIPTELLLPLLVISGGTIVGFFILEKILKNKIKVALIITLFLVLFFSYGHIYNILNDISPENFDLGKHRYLLIPFSVIFISGIIYFLKTKRKLPIEDTHSDLNFRQSLDQILLMIDHSFEIKNFIKKKLITNLDKN